MALHGPQSPSSQIHLLYHGLLHALLLWYPMGYRGTAHSTKVLFMGCKRTSTMVPRAPHPLPSLSALLCAGLFLTPLSPTCCISQRHIQYHSLALLWPAAGPFWSQCSWLLSDMDQLLDSSQRPVLKLPLLPSPCHVNSIHVSRFCLVCGIHVY